jgi:hypothetical protein
MIASQIAYGITMFFRIINLSDSLSVTNELKDTI